MKKVEHPVKGRLIDLQNITRFEEIEPLKEGYGESLPYFEDEFSEITLKVQLDPNTNNAGRTTEVIKKHVDFIKQLDVLEYHNSILDIGCGPGLYAQEFCSAFGQKIHYVGIDIGPKIIEHAMSLKVGKNYNFIRTDIFQYKTNQQFNLILMLYDFLNFFSEEKSMALLQKTKELLNSKGHLLLEIKIDSNIKKYKCQYAYRKRGMFSNQPHLEIVEEGVTKVKNVVGHRHIIYNPNNDELREYRNFLRIEDIRNFQERIKLIGLKVLGVWDTYEFTKEQKSNRLFVLVGRISDN